MRAISVILLAFFLFFISCSEDMAQDTKVKPMENKEKKTGMGLIPMTENEIMSVLPALKPLRGNLPVSYDLAPYFPPVGSQGAQGSCAAWSSGYNYKSFLENIERNWGYSSYDHIMSPAFVYNYAHRGESEYYCNNAGMTLKQAADILKYVGIVSWSEMPYDERVCSAGPSQQVINDAYEYRIDDYRRVEFNDFKTFLASNMPIFFGAEIYENFSNCWNYSSCMDEYARNGNVFKRLAGRSEGGHAMVIVGYDDRKQAFKIINSWGTSWGENGYLWISYSTLKTMMRNFGTFGYVFIDHIADPCEGIDCSGHGSCKVSAQKRAYCECDEGYENNMLECVKCESHTGKACLDGDVYWLNSCGKKEDIAYNCNNGCRYTGENDAECLDTCESHSTQKCYENAIYWYDSCGNRESKALDCGEAVCNDLGSGNVECKAVCEEKSEKRCYNGDVYWYNSCGERGLLLERCSSSCINSENGAHCDNGINDPCDNVHCPENSSCKVGSNNEAACYCDEGFHVNQERTGCEADDEDVCDNINCPQNSHCEANENQPACYCNEGYHVNDERTACVRDEDNLCESISCPENSSCRVYDNEAGCYCNEGYKVENGACVKEVDDVCEGINCEQWYANTVCVEYNGQPGCNCKEGYHWSGNNCVR